MTHSHNFKCQQQVQYLHLKTRNPVRNLQKIILTTVQMILWYNFFHLLQNSKFSRNRHIPECKKRRDAQLKKQKQNYTKRWATLTTMISKFNLSMNCKCL